METSLNKTTYIIIKIPESLITFIMISKRKKKHLSLENFKY